MTDEPDEFPIYSVFHHLLSDAMSAMEKLAAVSDEEIAKALSEVPRHERRRYAKQAETMITRAGAVRARIGHAIAEPEPPEAA